ncbi:hypothetical protein ANCCEY_03130 [Ancylostoma ceylanicum]|uniref:Uncharacterized protein n=1 Tax=Ancylostoma ceylanicum TaxID=53326 RepID=A0A0D6MBJ7_9BILA|nr:hypothetical protein ANCCEY_03130 [Ancylostoma ceylanicum]
MGGVERLGSGLHAIPSCAMHAHLRLFTLALAWLPLMALALKSNDAPDYANWKSTGITSSKVFMLMLLPMYASMRRETREASGCFSPRPLSSERRM